MHILISACLLGINCKYNGGNNLTKGIVESLSENHNLIPVCPESLGGLKSPRLPSELRNGAVYSKDGTDVTDYFLTGAEKVLYIAKKNNAKAAILKANSPSCGYGKIYDGTFSGNLIDGNGVTAGILAENGIKIYNENNWTELIDGQKG